MHKISNIEELEKFKSCGGVFILFGGNQCHVCHSLQPRLEEMLEQHYPDLTRLYIDCQSSPDICAQHSVFSLPVVQFYIEGNKITEFARSFSIEQLRQSMHRAYTLWHESR